MTDWLSRGLKGEEIPLGARIFAVADTSTPCDPIALTAKRKALRPSARKSKPGPAVSSILRSSKSSLKCPTTSGKTCATISMAGTVFPEGVAGQVSSESDRRS